jgi:two-component system OmpR family response regulator
MHGASSVPRAAWRKSAATLIYGKFCEIIAARESLSDTLNDLMVIFRLPRIMDLPSIFMPKYRRKSAAGVSNFLPRKLAARVCVLDDDLAIRSLLSRQLSPHYDVTFASSGARVYEMLQQNAVDLILLDIVLPGEDGLDIACSIRARSDIPLVLLSGLSATETIVHGLDVGADDYVTKPFSASLLRARLRNALRRAGARGGQRPATQQSITVDGCTVDTWSRRVSNAEGKWITLTECELHLLKALAQQPGKVVGRDALSRQLTGREWSPTNRSLDMHVSRLRKKLATVSGREKLISSFRGAGYALQD